jgi:phenylacetate-CoA ligase
MRLPDWVVGRIFEPAWDLYQDSPRLRTFRQLARTQFDPVEVLEERQRRRLCALVRHAADASPFHRQRLAAAGVEPAAVRSIADLRALPLLTKNDIREH